MLQNGDKDWYAWRKSFDLQVRSVWGDLDKLLVEMRDHEEPMDGRKYAKLLEEKSVMPERGTHWAEATSTRPTNSTWSCTCTPATVRRK